MVVAAARAATDTKVLRPQPSRWLRWLGPLAPQGTALPARPSPLRDPAQVWTMEMALARALDANPDVQVALATVQRQDGLRLQAVGQLLPHLGVVASTEEHSPSLIDRSAAELIAAGNPLNPQPLGPIATRSYNAQVELRQTLFDGLASWHALKRQALLEKKASIDARDLYLRVASQVRQAYDMTLARQSIVTVRRDAVRDLTHLAEVAQKRFEAGQISEYDSLRARSALSSAAADLATVESELARAEEVLCRMLYIDKPPGGLKLSGTLTLLDYRETFEAALSRAQAGRLDVRSAELQLDSSKHAQSVALAGISPRIEAYANYGYRSSYYDVHNEIDGWTVGVMGRWDIFDGGQTAGAVRTQKAERRIAEIRLAEAQKNVGSQVRELFSALDQSRAVMASHVVARDLGERAVSEARKEYEAGKVSLEQVLNAEINYRQVLVGWYGAIFNFNTAVYQLDYATGNEHFLDALAPAR